MENFFKGSEYQFQVMEIVMKVWEQKMLQANDWQDFYPMLIEKDSSRVAKIDLMVGHGLTDDQISEFKKLCEEKFGKGCPPSLCKEEIWNNKEAKTHTRYLTWKENRSVWPHAPLSGTSYGLDYEWYLKKQGKEFPADLLRAGEVRCDGVIYRPIWDTMEFVCACQDGIACSFKDLPGYYVPRNWRP